jgi:uncharacterized protein (TIGR03083 family)
MNNYDPPSSGSSPIEAFRAEAAALADVISGLSDAELGLASPCPPWTIAGLLCHIVIATGRIGPAVDAAGAAGRTAGDLVGAAGYYTPDARFSAAVNADRIDIAAALAARLRTAAAIRAELTAAARRSLELLEAAPPEQEVRTRHGDRMLLSQFAVTRVVELAVHGLDVAAGLGRSPWLTPRAAAVLEGLLLPARSQRDIRGLRDRLGVDRAGLIALLTGRAPLSAADEVTLTEHAVTRLALG